jgi:hypothetical protein
MMQVGKVISRLLVGETDGRNMNHKYKLCTAHSRGTKYKTPMGPEHTEGK